MRNFFIAAALLILAPIIINYGLLTWHMPGVHVENNPWLSFLGGYIAIFSAWSLSSYQYNRQRKDEEIKEKKQKEKDDLKDKQNNRSYFAFQDINVPGGIGNVTTHSDSRFINTKGYKWVNERFIRNTELDYSVPYLRFKQYGKNDFVIDAVLKIDWFVENSDIKEKINIQLGIIDKQVEIFVPVAVEGMEKKDRIHVNLIMLEYTTLRGERMVLKYSGNTYEEECLVLHDDGSEECLYRYNAFESEYFVPGKTIK